MKNELDLDILDLYIKEIYNYPLLSETEFQKLLEEYHNGNLKAKEIIINSNLRLVVKAAEKHCKKTTSMTLLDLIQEGNIGLTKAIESYDVSKSQFSTYARYFIEGYILNGIRKSDRIIRRPKYIYDLQHKYDNFVQKYYEINKEYPEDKILKKELNITDEVLFCLKNASIFKVDSYNKKTDSTNDTEDEIIDLLGSTSNKYDEVIQSIETFDYLNVIRDALNDLDYYLLYYRVLADESSRIPPKQLARDFNVTRQRIDQKVKSILNKVRLYCRIDSYSFNKRCDTLKAIYGKMYYRLDTKPVDPEKICLFLYLKKDLNTLEQQMLYLILIYRVKYSIEDLQQIFNLSEEINNTYNKLINMLNIALDSKEFIEYKIDILKEKGSSIYNEVLLNPEELSEIKKIII